MGEDLLRREAAEDLVEAVDFDAAGGGFVVAGVWRVGQCSIALRCGFRVGEFFDVDGDFVAQAAGERVRRGAAASWSCG